jgi:hypothetical protein
VSHLVNNLSFSIQQSGIYLIDSKRDVSTVQSTLLSSNGIINAVCSHGSTGVAEIISIKVHVAIASHASHASHAGIVHAERTRWQLMHQLGCSLRVHSLKNFRSQHCRLSRRWEDTYRGTKQNIG